MALVGKHDHVLIHDVIDPTKLLEFTQFLQYMTQYILSPLNQNSDAVQRVALYGFGDVRFRGSVFRLLQVCFLSDWYWSSETANNRWEMLVSIPTRNNVTIEHVESFCSLCKNGVTCDVIDRGVNDSLVTFLERIDRGKLHTGWMRQRLRQACERHRLKMREREDQDRVQQVTGRPYTTGNTLYFYHEWQNTLVDLEVTRVSVDTRTTQLSNVMSRLYNMTELILRKNEFISNVADEVHNHCNTALPMMDDQLEYFRNQTRRIREMCAQLSQVTVAHRNGVAETTLNRMNDLIVSVSSSGSEDVAVQ